MKLYELAGADPQRLFSPHCWKARFALAHKGLKAETVPWRYADKKAIAFTGQDRVPVLTHGERHVHDSWRIAEYLEQNYPQRPSLFGGSAGHALARFVNAWVDTAMNPGIISLIVTDLHKILAKKDKSYFRKSREERFGMKLEKLTADRDERVAGFRASLSPLRVTLDAQPYLGGDLPLYADYCAFASFVWARNSSTFELLEAGDPLNDWCERLYDAFDGLARSVPAMTDAA
ncbi:MAG: glutathione S-transferase family protein [Gammaproteobacteria bacterium]